MDGMNSRLTKFLAKIAGADISVEPRTEMEYWLNQIAQNGDSGGDTPATGWSKTLRFVDNTNGLIISCSRVLEDGTYVDDLSIFDGPIKVGESADGHGVYDFVLRCDNADAERIRVSINDPLNSQEEIVGNAITSVKTGAHSTPAYVFVHCDSIRVDTDLLVVKVYRYSDPV